MDKGIECKLYFFKRRNLFEKMGCNYNYFMSYVRCSKVNKIEHKEKMEDKESVVMSLKENTLTSTSATIMIKNKVQKEWIFSIDFSIEKNKMIHGYQ